MSCFPNWGKSSTGSSLSSESAFFWDTLYMSKLQNDFVRECFVGVTMEEGRVSVIQEAGTSCGRDKVIVRCLAILGGLGS